MTPQQKEDIKKEWTEYVEKFQLFTEEGWSNDSMPLADQEEFTTNFWLTLLDRELGRRVREIEDVFKKEVPPHKLSLEDGVWLKRLLNKAFKHNQN